MEDNQVLDQATQPTEPTPVNYEDLLKTDKALQSFMDSRISKATQTAITNAQAKWQKLQDETLSEADKLKELDEKGKLQYQLDKERKQREALEKKINAGTLKDETLSQMTEKGLPVEFLQMFDFERETAETVTGKLTSLKTLFDIAVENALNNKLKQTPPKTVLNKTVDKTTETKRFF